MVPKPRLPALSTRVSTYREHVSSYSPATGHIKMALRDWKIYVGGVSYFGLNTALASISAFLPTIITVSTVSL